MPKTKRINLFHMVIIAQTLTIHNSGGKFTLQPCIYPPTIFIFYSVSGYDIKGKQLLKTLGKNYIIDLGFRNMLLGYHDVDLGHILGNQINRFKLC